MQLLHLAFLSTVVQRYFPLILQQNKKLGKRRKVFLFARRADLWNSRNVRSWRQKCDRIWCGIRRWESCRARSRSAPESFTTITASVTSRSRGEETQRRQDLVISWNVYAWNPICLMPTSKRSSFKVQKINSFEIAKTTTKHFAITWRGMPFKFDNRSADWRTMTINCEGTMEQWRHWQQPKNHFQLKLWGFIK